MNTHEHDFLAAVAKRAAEVIADLPDPSERQQARAAMERGDVWLADRGEQIEVRCGDVSVYVHKASIGPRPTDPDDN